MDPQIIKWTKDTHRLLGEFFTEFADDFAGFPGGHVEVGYMSEIEHTNLGGRFGYIDCRVELLQRILTEQGKP